MSETANFNMKLPKSMKEAAQATFKSMGMDMATATHMTIRSDQVSSGATSVSRPTRDINSELNIINSFLAKKTR